MMSKRVHEEDKDAPFTFSKKAFKKRRTIFNEKTLDEKIKEVENDQNQNSKSDEDEEIIIVRKSKRAKKQTTKYDGDEVTKYCG